MFTLVARYFDGRSAASANAELILKADGGIAYIINGREGNASGDEIEISARLSGLPRTIRLGDGSFFEVGEDEAVDRWCRDCRNQAATGWLTFAENNWRFVAALAVLAVFAGWAIYRIGVPLLASPLAERVPAALISEIDTKVLDALDQSIFAPTMTSPGLKEAVESALQDLAPGEKYNLQFRSMDGIANAMALPAGTIIVTDQLIHDLTIDEVRAVLAHEIIHVRERHGLQLVIRSAALPAMIGFALGDVSAFLGAASALPVLLISQSYGREMEQEADVLGAELLADNGYNPMSLADALTKLTDGSDAEGMEWLRSHPDTNSRIRSIEEVLSR